MKSAYGEDLESFRDVIRNCYRIDVEPRLKECEANGLPLDIWRKAGAAGMLGVCVPEEYGGAGDKGLAIVADFLPTAASSCAQAFPDRRCGQPFVGARIPHDAERVARVPRTPLTVGEDHDAGRSEDDVLYARHRLGLLRIETLGCAT